MNKLIYICFLSLPVLTFACGGSNSNNMSQNNIAAQPYVADETTKPLSDDDLRDKIKDKLATGWFGKTFSDVDVDVIDGVVTISGTVETDQDKQDVEKKVKEFPEVSKVNNQLQVAPAKTPATSNA